MSDLSICKTYSSCSSSCCCCYFEWQAVLSIFLHRQTGEALKTQECTFWFVRIWHFVIPSVFINLFAAPENWHTTGRHRLMKMPLINVYLNCYCHPSLVVISFSEQLSISKSSFAGATAQALVRPRSKSKELREAHVNRSKSIKITLHLNCDLYWFAFQFSSIRPADCLEGLEG